MLPNSISFSVSRLAPDYVLEVIAPVLQHYYQVNRGMCSGDQFSGSVQLINETMSNSPTCRVSSCLRGIEPTMSYARAPYSAQALQLDYAPEDYFQLILKSWKKKSPT
ncbi:hypothetical protein K7X08_004008 [Anisodus acutangulus]|uniref:Uncharacterized protein n=1 Tax=Anisodus acutangulus TaxID=402998 RepID=A0A9Q1RJX4_9SOLA|nr:hypothetical protein K7X08_004008 [Anisodus acutangulus]